MYRLTFILQAFMSCMHCFSVRLFNGASDDEGIAQVYKNGTWGTICDIEYA